MTARGFFDVAMSVRIVEKYRKGPYERRGVRGSGALDRLPLRRSPAQDTSTEKWIIASQASQINTHCSVPLMCRAKALVSANATTNRMAVKNKLQALTTKLAGINPPKVASKSSSMLSMTKEMR